jgi:hypothetical protein
LTVRSWFWYEQKRYVIIGLAVAVPIAAAGLLFAIAPLFALLSALVLVFFALFDQWLRPRLLKRDLKRQVLGNDSDVVDAGATVMATLALSWNTADRPSHAQVVDRARRISKRDDDYYNFLIKAFSALPEVGARRNGK